MENNSKPRAKLISISFPKYSKKTTRTKCPTDLEIPRNSEYNFISIFTSCVRQLMCTAVKAVNVYPSSLYGGLILCAVASGEKCVDVD